MAALWQSVAARGRHSFFLTWHWVGCWLRESGVSPVLLFAMRGQTPVGAAILCRPRDASPSRVVPKLHLNSAGDGGFDAPFIEYNGFLLAEDGAAQIEEAMVAGLAAMPAFRGHGKGLAWGRLSFPGVEARLFAALERTGLPSRQLTELPSPYVDLGAIRAGGVAYLATRSRNTRQQIRRSIRLFEASGPLKLSAAANIDEAFAIFSELKTLHQRRWTAKGKPGAFAEPFFENFHQALIRDAWPSGAIDLLRVSAGERTIGCLYNFLHQGCAYAYQSGFTVDDDARLKPGLISHALAIERYLAAGLDRYLLLAGESRYKISLATGSDTLYWLETTRPGLLGSVSRLAEVPRYIASSLSRRFGRAR